MTVQELIDILQTLPKDKVMQALDTNGDWNTDLSIWHYADRVEILGTPDEEEWALMRRSGPRNTSILLR